MIQLKEKSNMPQTNGIVEKLQLLKKSESQSPNNLSPKEAFLLREKSLKLKMGLFIALNNFIWIFIFLTPQEVEPLHAPLPISANHEIIKLPAQIFSESPSTGKKIHVLLKHSSSNFRTSGYLRLVENDPYGETGIKATLEIPKENLQKLNRLTSYWLIYPFFKQVKSKPTQQKVIREIIF